MRGNLAPDWQPFHQPLESEYAYLPFAGERGANLPTTNDSRHTFRREEYMRGRETR